jgi:hypothetical protein
MDAKGEHYSFSFSLIWFDVQAGMMIAYFRLVFKTQIMVTTKLCCEPL